MPFLAGMSVQRYAPFPPHTPYQPAIYQPMVTVMVSRREKSCTGSRPCSLFTPALLTCRARLTAGLVVALLSGQYEQVLLLEHCSCLYEGAGLRV